MRIVLLSIICFLLFEPPPIGCSYFSKKVPPEAFPEKIGEFTREDFDSLVTNNVEFLYYKGNKADSNPLNLKIMILKDGNEAKSYLDSSLNNCSKENESNSKPLLEQELKDKSGNLKGIIRSCQTFYGEHKNYHLEMTNDDLMMLFRTINQASDLKTAPQIDLNDVVEFAKNIPHNANLDFEGLKIEE